MTAKVKFGLIAGVVGLLLNICVSAVMGICGPFTALLTGAAAGFLAANAEKPLLRSDGARTGLIAGLIAGVLVVVGQVIGNLGMLAFIQLADIPTLFGPPPAASDISQQFGYWLGGVGVVACFGIFDIGMAAISGAGGGYLGAPSNPPAETPSQIDSPQQSE